MKQVITLIMVLALCTSATAQLKLKNVLKEAKETVLPTGVKGLTQQEAGSGLKEALNVGVEQAVSFLSAEDGYFKSAYKILLPEEAQKVTNKLKMVPGFANVEADLVEKLNRAAEDAAEKAKPIFVGAIKQMTFKDALNILSGNRDAATRYLEGATYDQLYSEFMPIIQASLDKVNARSTWKKAVTAYNKIPLVKKTNPELDDYVNQQALLGMFKLVEKKEEDIRTNSSARSSDLLKKVFANQNP